MPLKTHRDEQPSLNLTSMIDVLFLLIIFFMAGSQFIDADRAIDLDVPRVNDRGALTSAPEKKVVNVFRDGTITLDGVPVTLPELTTRLASARAQYADAGVLIRGDADSRFQPVADALNACKQAGIAELAISVKLADNSRTR